MSVSISLPWYARLAFRLGRPVVLLGVLLMSVPGEIHMAELAGWSPRYAHLMPVCVSVYAACAAVIADVAKRCKLPNRQSALVGAGMSLVLAMSAQTVAHLIAQNYMGMSALLVAIVSCIPPLAGAHMLHLAAAPLDLSSTVETVEDEEAEEDGQLTSSGGVAKSRRAGRRGGRVGPSPEAIRAAAEQLAAAGQPVNAMTLGGALGRSARQGRRYVQALGNP